MMKRINWKRLAIAIVIILITAVSTGVVLWMQGTLGPSSTATKALQSEDQVSVSQEDGFITFEPAAGSPTAAFIL